MDEHPWPRYLPMGDSALVVEFGNTIDPETNLRVHALSHDLIQAAPDGFGETIPTYRSLLVHYDPMEISFDMAVNTIRERVGRLETMLLPEIHLVEIPTIYGGNYGPDLENVARSHHLTEEEVIRIHCEREYRVYMIGFTPGFPYLGSVDERIVTPRLVTPRKLVPAGSVGIAGEQTGIYPIQSPGGWQLIGFTSLILFDPGREPPSLLSPGDRVKFIPVSSGGNHDG